jgi:hypothetical protein
MLLQRKGSGSPGMFCLAHIGFKNNLDNIFKLRELTTNIHMPSLLGKNGKMEDLVKIGPVFLQGNHGQN